MAKDLVSMQRVFSSAFILLFGLEVPISHADFTAKGHLHTRSATRQDFFNPACRQTASCELKRFSLIQAENEIWFSDNPNYPTYGNGVIIEYETASVNALENFAVVQFKKGCVFDSVANRAGKVQRSITDTVASFGELVPFCFRRWVIDSQDRDPAYNSDPKLGRFYYLRWNQPGSYDNRTQKFYGGEKPLTPVLYMSDYPAGAFIAQSAVRNVALQFKSCIYKAREVPAVSRRDDIDFAKPIHCFDWQNIYVYDFARGRFRTDLAAVPNWDEPLPPIASYRRAAVIALWIAIAAVMMWSLFPFRRGG